MASPTPTPTCATTSSTSTSSRTSRSPSVDRTPILYTSETDDHRDEDGTRLEHGGVATSSKALVVRNVAEPEYLRTRYALEMLTHMTSPIRTTAVPVGEAVFFRELPGGHDLAGAVKDVRVGGEGRHRASDVGGRLGHGEVRVLLYGLSPRRFG